MLVFVRAFNDEATRCGVEFSGPDLNSGQVVSAIVRQLGQVQKIMAEKGKTGADKRGDLLGCGDVHGWDGCGVTE